jgi:hypothetical protein
MESVWRAGGVCVVGEVKTGSCISFPRRGKVAAEQPDESLMVVGKHRVIESHMVNSNNPSPRTAGTLSLKEKEIFDFTY